MAVRRELNAPDEISTIFMHNNKWKSEEFIRNARYRISSRTAYPRYHYRWSTYSTFLSYNPKPRKPLASYMHRLNLSHTLNREFAKISTSLKIPVRLGHENLTKQKKLQTSKVQLLKKDSSAELKKNCCLFWNEQNKKLVCSLSMSFFSKAVTGIILSCILVGIYFHI